VAQAGDTARTCRTGSSPSSAVTYQRILAGACTTLTVLER
jgi:hypothetical protein